MRPHCRLIHTVRPGDTMSEIAAAYKVPLDDIIFANSGLVDPYRLIVGQHVCIPHEALERICPPHHYVYIIRRGDTFFQIAERAGVDVSDLLRANRGIQPASLLVGQRLCIPPKQS